MQYMFSLISEEPNWEDVDPEQMQAEVEAMGRYNRELEEAGAMVTGAGLRERATATVLSFPEGGGDPTVTDGPFAETKEQLMGFWIVEAANLDEALAWARKVPLQGASLEVRPLVDEQGDDELSSEEILSRVQDKS
jgi:hypothetical protein